MLWAQLETDLAFKLYSYFSCTCCQHSLTSICFKSLAALVYSIITSLVYSVYGLVYSVFECHTTACIHFNIAHLILIIYLNSILSPPIAHISHLRKDESVWSKFFALRFVFYIISWMQSMCPRQLSVGLS